MACAVHEGHRLVTYAGTGHPHTYLPQSEQRTAALRRVSGIRGIGLSFYEYEYVRPHPFGDFRRRDVRSFSESGIHRGFELVRRDAVLVLANAGFQNVVCVSEFAEECCHYFFKIASKEGNGAHSFTPPNFSRPRMKRSSTFGFWYRNSWKYLVSVRAGMRR